MLVIVFSIPNAVTRFILLYLEKIIQDITGSVRKLILII